MPTKIITETQLLRKLSNTPLQICVDFLQTASYTSTHTDPEHLKQFYYTFDQIKDRRYDGMIITGAPLDYVPYEETAYWDEVCKIMEWTRHTFTVHSIWERGNTALKKFDLNKKLFGIFPHQILKLLQKKAVLLLRQKDRSLYFAVLMMNFLHLIPAQQM